MVLNSKPESGTHVLSAGVREILESIKEVVGNHSDADIYVALKETNMDPNETAQKLLNQGVFFDPFLLFLLVYAQLELNGYRGFVLPISSSL